METNAFNPVISPITEEEKIVDSPDCPPLDSNLLPTDYKTRALSNAPPGMR